MKNKQDPVALEDGEYPEWLWSALRDARRDGKEGGGGEEGDLFCTSQYPPPNNLYHSIIRFS